MATGYAGFFNAIRDMVIVGVNVNKKYPPKSMDSADLPASWVELPEGNDSPITFNRGTTWPKYQAELTIAIKPFSQGEIPDIMPTALALMDNLALALSGLDASKSALSWSIYPTMVAVGNVDYWAVTATISGAG